ncbi:MAG TPA: glycerate kinase [Dehalococcoidia bacterium]|nr:glycerate kinase [Dehalococcoidia bacterium]
MRVLVAPQEFKGSLTASEAAAAIAAGVRDALPGATVDVVPMSDGGAGLVDALLAARGGERITTRVHDPLMRPVDATWAHLADGTAAIEMAAASGLILVAPAERKPLAATTYGTGELVRAALDRGCTRIIVGVGGSATVDAGAGALQALGVRLLAADGVELPRGAGPPVALDRIDLSHRDPRLARATIRVACDVTNTLCGPEGAAAVFGPQKGASPDQVPLIDAALRRFATVAARDAGVDVLAVAGGGAAGGLAAGLIAGAGATIERGFPLVAHAVGLAARVAAADLVIAGEGRLDAQTSFGKTAAGVADLARAHGRPVAIVAGVVDPAYDRSAIPFDAVEQATPSGMAVGDAMRDAARLLRQAAARVTRACTSAP